MLEHRLATNNVCTYIGFEIESAHLQDAEKSSEIALRRFMTRSRSPGRSDNTEKSRKGPPFVLVHSSRI